MFLNITLFLSVIPFDHGGSPAVDLISIFMWYVIFSVIHYWILPHSLIKIDLQPKQSNPLLKYYLWTISSLYFDFKITVAVYRVASVICRILLPLTSIRSIASTTLKSFDIENSTTGFKGDFSLFHWNGSVLLNFSSKISLHWIPETLTNLKIFLAFELPNWLCNFLLFSFFFY